MLNMSITYRGEDTYNLDFEQGDRLVMLDRLTEEEIADIATFLNKFLGKKINES